MAITLTKDDFNTIGQVAKHCNLPKLQIAINESILFDLKPLLCDLFIDVNDNWDSQDKVWTNIIFPLDYEGCNNKPKQHQGLKNVLIRYAYARYVIINGLDDTPNGSVTKTNEWSIPKPYSDLKQISDRYRTMGYELFKEIESYICLNKEDYENSNFECTTCGCNGKCGTKTKSKGYGIKSSNIGKKI